MKHIAICILLLFSIRGFSQNSLALDNERLLDFIQTQRYKEAAEYIKSAYPGEINDDKIISRLGYVYYMNGNLPEAEKNYLILLKKDTLNKSVLLNLASLNNRRGNYIASTDYYKKILHIDSTIFNVYKQLADVGQITNDSNTVYYLKKANMLNPVDGDVAYDLSDLYIGLKEYKAADSILKVAIQADTTNLLLYRAKAKLSYATKEYKELITICEKLFNGGDHTPTVYKWLGNANFYVKNYRKSINTFLELEKVEELDESALYMVAKSYKILEDEKNAIDYYQRAIKAGTASSESVFYYYYELGDLYKTVKKPKSSIQAYEKSIQYQETPFAYYMLAILYDQDLKNKTSALKYYKKYVLLTGQKAEYNDYLTYAKARINELLR
jgi:tetratricopeptide (TPR) repeat protein